MVWVYGVTKRMLRSKPIWRCAAHCKPHLRQWFGGAQTVWCLDLPLIQIPGCHGHVLRSHEHPRRTCYDHITGSMKRVGKIWTLFHFWPKAHSQGRWCWVLPPFITIWCFLGKGVFPWATRSWLIFSSNWTWYFLLYFWIHGFDELVFIGTGFGRSLVNKPYVWTHKVKPNLHFPECVGRWFQSGWLRKQRE